MREFRSFADAVNYIYIQKLTMWHEKIKSKIDTLIGILTQYQTIMWYLPADLITCQDPLLKIFLFYQDISMNFAYI